MGNVYYASKTAFADPLEGLESFMEVELTDLFTENLLDLEYDDGVDGIEIDAELVLLGEELEAYFLLHGVVDPLDAYLELVGDVVPDLGEGVVLE